MTVLFADLVGFTARAERLDPEDVRALLSPYYARLRAELERHGGTVEKFIGDAVMALFGAPVAHEDDPERAVRAALAIRDGSRETRTDCRCASPSTPARRSSARRAAARARGWPPATWSTRPPACKRGAGERDPGRGDDVSRDPHTIEYREAQPVKAKGKSEPVPVWEAIAARAFGVDSSSVESRSSVGNGNSRCSPTRSLVPGSSGPSARDARRRARDRQEQARLRAVQGVETAGPDLLAPGTLAPLRRGRQLLGACRDGEGAGGDPRDGLPRRSPAKLRRAVEPSCLTRRGAWVERHLRPLVGVGDEVELGRSGGRRRSPPGGGSSRRSPNSVRSCWSSRTSTGRTTACWTSSTTSSTGRAACRCSSSAPPAPNCSSAAPAGAAASRTRRRYIAPLSDDETARLLGALLEQPLLAGRAAVGAARPGRGNPLYAEEYVGCSREDDSADEMPLPETVQGIIAARLDSPLERGEGLLQNAAVVGKVFWRGAAAAIDGRRSRRDRGAAARARAQRVRAAGPGSSVADETRVHVQAPARAGRRLRPDPARPRARTSIAPRPSGSSRSAAAGRLRRRCSPTTTWRRSSSPGRSATNRGARRPDARSSSRRRRSRVLARVAQGRP